MEYFELFSNAYHRMNIPCNLDNQKAQRDVDRNSLINLKLVLISWVQKITIAPLKNRLSLNYTLRNIESAANSIQKTIVVHARVHLPF